MQKSSSSAFQAFTTKSLLRAWLDQHSALAILLLGVIAVLRLTHLNYNTLFVDEAIYINVGQAALQRDFTSGATKWMFGSYFYPMLVSIADQLAGTVGARVLSVLLSVLSALFVYLTTRRILTPESALLALLFFGFSGISISIGQQAVIDSLGIPLLAATTYFVTLAAGNTQKQKTYLLVAGTLFSLSVMAKYIALLYFPALLLIFIALLLRNESSIQEFIVGMRWVYFLTPLMLILGTYTAVYYRDLIQVFIGDYAQQIVTRSFVLQTIREEIGFLVVLAAAGIAVALWPQQPARTPLPYLKAGTLALLFLVLFMALPLYHLATGNYRSISKHHVYALLFLAPLAGHSLAVVIRFLRRQHTALQPIGAVLTVLLMVGFVRNATAQNTAFQYSWPNATSSIAYLRSLDLNTESHILASGSDIYAYYLHLGGDSQDIWTNTWYLEYQGLTGLEAVIVTVKVCLYDAIVLDDYYDPAANAAIEPLLPEAGYEKVYDDVQDLHIGAHINTRIYLPSNQGSCAVRFDKPMNKLAQ